MTPAESRALALIVAARGPYATEPALRAQGVRAATLRGLFATGWLDCCESTPGEDGGDYLEGGTLWTFTPLGAARWGVRLEEFEDERPVWVAWNAPGPVSVVVAPQPRQRPLDVTLAWVEAMVARRRAEREERAREAEERLREERRKGFWGRRRFATRKRGRK